jgi:hypothetical protein
MKRYVCAWGETAYKPVYLADEVDTERAKDKEEIARLKEEINLVCSKLPHCWGYYLNENREEEGRERE